MSPSAQSNVHKKLAATLAAGSALGALSAFSFPSRTMAQTLPTETASSAAVMTARAFAIQNTHEPIGPLGKLAASQLVAFGQALGVPAAQLRPVKVANHGTFVIAITDEWVYTADVAGNQTFRPLSDVRHLAAGQADPPMGADQAADTSGIQTDRLTRITSAVAASTSCDVSTLPGTIVKKEILAVGHKGQDASAFYNGRFVVRRCSSDNLTFFQLVCDCHYGPIRLDTNVQNEVTTRISRSLLELLKGVPGQSRGLSHAGPISVSSFYSPMESRFITSASLLEGEVSLSPTGGERTIPPEPFGPIEFASDAFGQFNARTLDVGAIRKSADYLDNAKMWFQRGGQVGAARGVYDPGTRTWSNPAVTVSHRSLEKYSLVGGEPAPPETVSVEGRSFRVPHAVSRRLEQRFYDDLAGSTVAFFFTHAGQIDGRTQFARGRDVWFDLGGGEDLLGRGSCRHLLFYGCSPMGGFEERDESHPSVSTLFHEWMSASDLSPVGIRTISGADGLAVEGNVTGVQYFNEYNKGNSVTDSFAFGYFNAWNRICPVTIAYGGTVEEALGILADGRFSAQAVSCSCSVASIWRRVKE